MPGKHTVAMGGVRKAVITDRCPWSVVFTDRLAEGYLRAYGARERWGLLPPGRNDPRLFDALAVIASEHHRIDDEKLKPGGR